MKDGLERFLEAQQETAPTNVEDFAMKRAQMSADQSKVQSLSNGGQTGRMLPHSREEIIQD